MSLRVFRPAEYVFGDYFGVPQHVDAQVTISSKIIVCCSVFSVPWGFSSAEYVFGHYIVVLPHADVVVPIYSKFECAYCTGRYQENHVSQKTFPWFCSTCHLESLGTAVG